MYMLARQEGLEPPTQWLTANYLSFR